MGIGSILRKTKNVIGDAGMTVAEPFTQTKAKRDIRGARNAELSGLASADQFLKDQYASNIDQTKLGLGIGSGALERMNQATLDGSMDMDNTQYGGPTQFQGKAPGAYQDTGFAHNFEADPGYKFRLKESLDNAQASAAAGGSLFSGDTLSALARKSGEMASDEFQNSYARQRGAYESDRAFGYNQNQDQLGQFNTDRSSFNNRVDADRGNFNSRQDAKNAATANRFDRLSSLAGFYTDATRSNVDSGNTLANNLAGNSIAAGASIGNAKLAQANARNQGYLNTGSAIKFGVDAYKGKGK